MSGKKERSRTMSAERYYGEVLKLSHYSLVGILPVTQRRVENGEWPRFVLEELIERIEHEEWDELSHSDKALVIRAKEAVGL